MIFRCIPISKKQDGCSSKEQPSQSVKEPLISRAARRPRQRVLGAVCKKKKAPSSQMVLFWSGRRGSNSLPGIPRMAMAIRGSPASPRMISRAARRSRQRVLGAVCKKESTIFSQSPIRMFFAGIRCNPTIGVAPFSLFQTVSLYSCEFALILAIRLLISSSVGMSISPIAVK